MTLLLFFLGPLIWYTPNNLKLLLFLSANILFICLGYFYGVNKITKESDFPKRNYIRLARILIKVSLIFAIITFLNNLNLDSLSLQEISRKILATIKNPEKAYSDRGNANFGGKIFTYLTVIMAPITWPAIPIGLYFLKKLKFQEKILLFLLILFEALSWFIIGTNKGIIDIMLVILWVFILKTPQTKRKLILSLFVVGLIAVVIVNFVNNIGGRLAYVNVLVSDHYRINKNWIDEGGNLSIFQKGIIYLTSYLTQGYYGLSLGMESSSSYVLGIGSSYFLIENFKEILGIDLSSKLIQFKIASTGWSALGNWHSLYLSIANEVGFILVPVVMMFYAYMFGLSINNLKKQFSYMSFVVSILMFILFVYVPANNQLMQYSKTAFLFLTIIPIWLLKQWGVKLKL